MNNANVLFDEVLHLTGAYFTIESVGAVIELLAVIVECVVSNCDVFDRHWIIVRHAYPAYWTVYYPEPGDVPVNQFYTGIGGERGVTCFGCATSDGD